MREIDAALGIELAGHFFFKDTFFSEGGPLPVFMVLEVMRDTGKTLSELVTKARRYYQSTEINSTISRTTDEIYAELKEIFSDAEFLELDGLTITYPDWWCNVRASQTEPVMRMNLEADTNELMEEKRDKVLEIIRS